jgi:NTP pyrophosphatase (non-canonical NTP hydrolase)
MEKPIHASTTTLSEMQAWLDQFAAQRDWERFHTPKNLAMSIAIEAAEIMELVQWQEGSEPLATVLKIDPAQALALKIKKNAIKYPELNPHPTKPPGATEQ